MRYGIKNNFSKIENIRCTLVYGNIELIDNPYISVVVPTFKRDDLLENCILSIVNQKNVDFVYEIIVVDNEECDGESETERLIKKLNLNNLLYYRNEKNVGGAGNWNRCILLARAKWIVMCHDDDWLKEDCLNTMKHIIEEHKYDKKEIGYIRSAGESWYDSRLRIERKNKKSLRIKKKRTALIKNGYLDVLMGGGATWVGAPTCGTLINRDAVLYVGGYNDELSPCFDCYVPYNMLSKYNVYKTYYSFGFYRWSENDTYNEETLLGLVAAYADFLRALCEKSSFVSFFSNEHYADCVKYYLSKAREANIELSRDKLKNIRELKFSKIKLIILYILRRICSGIKIIVAK